MLKLTTLNLLCLVCYTEANEQWFTTDTRSKGIILLLPIFIDTLDKMWFILNYIC